MRAIEYEAIACFSLVVFTGLTGYTIKSCQLDSERKAQIANENAIRDREGGVRPMKPRKK